MRPSPHRIAAGWLCALVSATCATGSVAGPCPPKGEAVTLLRVDCVGAVTGGLARGRVDGFAVVLELEPGPSSAASLVASWPPFGMPPWVGHGALRAIVLGDAGIRVEFLAEPQLALFADPRLAPPGASPWPLVAGDGRDRVDSGSAPFRSRDERTVEYARSRGKAVEREGFMVRYHLVLRRPVESEVGQVVARRIGEGWVRSGPPGARRLPGPEVPLDARCVPPREPESPGGLGPDSSGAAPATAAYPPEDPAARALAERLVSESLPGRFPHIGLEGLRVRAAHESLFAPATSDAAVILPVATGVHPCSEWGELRLMESRLSVDESPATTERDVGQRTFPLGESAIFRIDPRR